MENRILTIKCVPDFWLFDSAVMASSYHTRDVRRCPQESGSHKPLSFVSAWQESRARIICRGEGPRVQWCSAMASCLCVLCILLVRLFISCLLAQSRGECRKSKTGKRKAWIFSVQSLPDLERVLCNAISWEKREQGPASLETCPSSAGLPPAAHPPFSRPNLMLEHPLFAHAAFCQDFA